LPRILKKELGLKAMELFPINQNTTYGFTPLIASQFCLRTSKKDLLLQFIAEEKD
tara:strand:- start:17 stop:181 length:165 start_codon:yes stop_codon:yes gene_type:complete